MSCSAIAEQDQYSSAWLAGLKMMAVQPACLKSQPIMQLQHHQHQGPDLRWGDYNMQSEQHELLLHLNVLLTAEQPTSQPESTSLRSRHASVLPPLLLQHATLDLIVLTRQMQVLQHQQFSLPTLLKQHSIVEGAGDGSSSRQSSSSRCNNSSWPVLLNLRTSIACPSSERLLDCLHLVLMLSSSGPQQQQLRPVNTAVKVKSVLAPAVPAGIIIADVPLLVLPAAAQQEVQQLLLPAMRQEVQAEQQQQQHIAASPLQGNAEQCQRACLAVEHAAWRHFSHLARDVYTVLQLSLAAEAAAAATTEHNTDVSAGLPATGASSSSAFEGAAASSSADTAALLDGEVSPCTVTTSQDSRTAATGVPAPGAALKDLADSLLFPLLLPFLASQGLHNMLRLLLLCLPVEMQQQWQQEQLVRLCELSNASPPVHLPVFMDQLEVQQSKDGSADVAAQPLPPHESQHESCSIDGGRFMLEGERSLSKGTQPRSSNAAASKQEEPQHGTTKAPQEQQQQHQGKLHQQPEQATAPAVVATLGDVVGDADVPWYLPFTEFPDCATERSYVAWKHHALLHLDYVAAMFGLFYLAVLLRRLMSEPTSYFYFAVIFTKVLPHLPLVFGMRQTFLQYRETWLLLVAPTMALTALVLFLPSIAHGQPALLLPNKAYRAYWNSRGEVQTTVLRPFTQHMRLKRYVAYTLLDAAAISAWVFGQVLGIRAAVVRWGFASVLSVGLSWGLDLYMRRRFVKAVHRQTQLRELQYQPS